MDFMIILMIMVFMGEIKIFLFKIYKANKGGIIFYLDESGQENEVLFLKIENKNSQYSKILIKKNN